MDNTKNQPAEPKEAVKDFPSPEVLAPRADDNSAEAAAEAPKPAAPASGQRPPRRNSYKVSHRATFIGLAVVVIVLVVNAGAVAFLLKRQSKANSPNREQVTLSQGILDKVGVNRSTIGPSGLELVVGPNARFNGEVEVGGNVTIAKGLKINSRFTASEATLTQLKAGDTALAKLNVNGDSSLSQLTLRDNLQVSGTSRLQGPVNINQLLTVNNSANISGNLSVGGVLSANGLAIRSLSVSSNLTVGGHIITAGFAPGVSAGSAVGSNGTVSISGNDASGTVAVNVGTGGGHGVLANISFRNHYGNTPHVVISPIGAWPGSFYVNRNSGGFSISTISSVSPGGYAFDYIVEQ